MAHSSAAALCLSGLGAGGGCATDTGTVAAWQRWDDAGVRDYSFHLRSGCADDDGPGRYGVPPGRFAVEVRDRQVANVTAMDRTAETTLADQYVDRVPSISGLFEMMIDASADGADRVETRFDDTDGHPTSLVIDDYPGGDSNTDCFKVTAYRAR